MKFSLTITEATEAEISRIMSFLSGTTSPVAITAPQPQPSAIPPMPQNGGNDEDGDETGPVNTDAPAVDSSGLPWDERIHSSNKATTDKGVWRKRRGVSDTTVAAVEAELRARTAPNQPAPMFTEQQPAPVMQMPAPAPQPQPMPQMQPAPQPMPTMPAPAPMPVQSQPTQPQPMPQTAPPVPQPTATGVSMDFPTFMQALSQQMQKRDANGMPLIDTEYLARVTSEVSTAFGVPLGVITDIVSQPRAAEMIVYAVQCMQRDQKW